MTKEKRGKIPDFEDGEEGLDLRNILETALETGRGKKTDNLLEPPRGAPSY